MNLRQKNADVKELHVHYKIEMRKIIEEERVKRRQMQIKFGARVEELFNRLESVKTFIQRQVLACPQSTWIELELVFVFTSLLCY